MSPSNPTAPGQLRISRHAWLAFGVAVATVLVDQLSKAWVLDGLRLPERGTIPVLPIFRLTWTGNPGVSFGLLKAQGGLGVALLVAFSMAVVVALAVWATRVQRAWTALAIGLVMGGAIGNNLIDRIRQGYVTDFLDFTALHFPWIFNGADSAISIGVGLLLAESLLAPKKA